MTKNNDFKKRVRALAAREGIPYSEARRRINQTNEVPEIHAPAEVTPELAEARAAYDEIVPRILADLEAAKDQPYRSRSTRKASSYAELLSRESPFKVPPAFSPMVQEALRAGALVERDGVIVVDLGPEEGADK